MLRLTLHLLLGGLARMTAYSSERKMMGSCAEATLRTFDSAQAYDGAAYQQQVHEVKTEHRIQLDQLAAGPVQVRNLSTTKSVLAQQLQSD